MNESQADQLVEIAFERYDFGVSTDGTPYAVPREGSCVARELRGKASLRKELALAFRNEFGKVPSTNALSAALEVLEGACADAEPRDVHVRVARLGNEVYLDLGAVDHKKVDSFVRITAGGWELVPIVPCLFRRTPLTSRLPKPEAGGSIESLFQFLNLDIPEARLIVRLPGSRADGRRLRRGLLGLLFDQPAVRRDQARPPDRPRHLGRPTPGIGLDARPTPRSAERRPIRWVRRSNSFEIDV